MELFKKQCGNRTVYFQSFNKGGTWRLLDITYTFWYVLLAGYQGPSLTTSFSKTQTLIKL